MGEVSGSLVRARLLKRSVEVRAALYNTVKVQGPTKEKPNALISDIDLSNNLEGGIYLYVSGRNILSLVEMGEYQAEKSIDLMPPICIWVYVVPVCVRVGAVAEQRLFTGKTRALQRGDNLKKYLTSGITTKLGFFASGTVHAWIVEGRVRAMGTLMNVGLEAPL